MKKFLWFGLIVLCTLFVSLLHAGEKLDCYFLDLAGHERVVYEPFLGLMAAAGFSSTYAGLDVFADDSTIIDKVAASKGLFLVVAPDLLATIDVSPLGIKLKNLLNRISERQNYFVALLLPSFNRVGEHVALLPALKDLFTPLGIGVNFPLLGALEQQTKQPIQVRDLSAAAIDFFLKNPINLRPMPYHTTLALPHEGRLFTSKVLTAAHNHPTLSLTFLPAYARRFVSSKVRSTLPYFLYNFSQAKKLHLLVGYDMLASGFGITEQYHVRPLKTSIAKEMLDLMGLSLAQFYSVIVNVDHTKKNFHEVVRKTGKPDFSQVVESFGKMNKKKSNKLAKVAWMELTMFEPLTPEQAKKIDSRDRDRRQKKLISYLVAAKFDALWITFNPHQYWSPIARKKEREEIFLASIRSFTRQLSSACKRARIKYPALLVGFEITNNIYEPNLPKNFSIDAFGNEFKDIPAPLDLAFWDNEIVNSLQELVKRWQDPLLSHGMQLKGIVLDLEMYCRKRTGAFGAALGFDRGTLAAFDGSFKDFTLDTHAVIKNLMDEQKYTAFLSYKVAKARELGLRVRRACKKLLGPDAHLVCYAQNLMIDWFYKGLYQGLSTKQDPLILLTFNAEFMRHQAWLEQHNIFVEHGCVVLLSKILTSRHFGYVNYVRQGHNCVWLNRVSRMVETYEPQSWIAAEQTPLQEKGKELFACHVGLVS